MKAQYKEIEEKMNKTLDSLYREFGTIRAGKASPSVLDRVTVDYYGAATPIQQLATISTSDARTSSAKASLYPSTANLDAE